jgi:DNA-binding PadR family transcriptional regulator
MSNKRDARVDPFRGTLDVMIFPRLETLGPLHGYAISARLERVSGGALHLNLGTLYPGFMRLEQRGVHPGAMGLDRQQSAPAIPPRGRRELANERDE